MFCQIYCVIHTDIHICSRIVTRNLIGQAKKKHNLLLIESSFKKSFIFNYFPLLFCKVLEVKMVFFILIVIIRLKKQTKYLFVILKFDVT